MTDILNAVCVVLRRALATELAGREPETLADLVFGEEEPRPSLEAMDAAMFYGLAMAHLSTIGLVERPTDDDPSIRLTHAGRAAAHHLEAQMLRLKERIAEVSL